MNPNEKKELRAVSDDLGKEMGIHPCEGNWYTFVTPGPIYYGKLSAILGDRYVLEDMAWIPDTGRAHVFVLDPSSANEVEYIGTGVVLRGAVLGIYFNPSGKKIDTK